MKQALTVLCCFVVAAATWLCLMENVLHHDGYIVRSVVAVLIAAQSLATLLVVRRGGHAVARTLVAIGAIGAALFGTSAIVTTLRTSHFEGFVLIIGLALILEAVLALLVLFQPRPPSGLRPI